MSFSAPMSAPKSGSDGSGSVRFRLQRIHLGTRFGRFQFQTVPLTVTRFGSRPSCTSSQAADVAQFQLRKAALKAARGAALTAHSAAGVATRVSKDAERLLSAAEGVIRAAAALLEVAGTEALPTNQQAAASSPVEPAVPAAKSAKRRRRRNKKKVDNTDVKMDEDQGAVALVDDPATQTAGRARALASTPSDEARLPPPKRSALNLPFAAGDSVSVTGLTDVVSGLTTTYAAEDLMGLVGTVKGLQGENYLVLFKQLDDLVELPPECLRTAFE